MGLKGAKYLRPLYTPVHTEFLALPFAMYRKSIGQQMREIFLCRMRNISRTCIADRFGGRPARQPSSFPLAVGFYSYIFQAFFFFHLNFYLFIVFFFSFSSLLFCNSVSSETLSLEYYCRRTLRTQQKSSALP